MYPMWREIKVLLIDDDVQRSHDLKVVLDFLGEEAITVNSDTWCKQVEAEITERNDISAVLLGSCTNIGLSKMVEDITDVTKEILPGEKLDCVAYGCTSGTVAAGYNSIKEKINLAKPEAKVTTPITSAIKALKVLGIDKISIFTPYTKTINDSVVNYFKKENITVNSLTYFNIDSDLDIGKVDEDYLFEVLSKIDLEDSDALFVSCTALPVLSIIDRLEKKLNKVILSSNQTLIWDSLNEINYKEKIEGFGKLFNS